MDISIATHQFIGTIPKGLNPYISKDRERLETRANDIAGKTMASIRKSIGQRDKGLCYVCGTNVYTNPEQENVELHHVTPLSQGGTWALENLVLVHATCHKQVTHNLKASDELRQQLSKTLCNKQRKDARAGCAERCKSGS